MNKISKIDTKRLLPFLIAFSMLCFAIRGKYGAILITLLNVILLLNMKKEKRARNFLSSYYILAIFSILLIFGIFGNNSFKYYLFISFLTGSLIFLDKKIYIKRVIKNFTFSHVYALFIFVFVLLIGVIRNCSFEYYLFIGYLTSILILLNNNIEFS